MKGRRKAPESEEFYFLVKEPHCKGHEEEQVQTIAEWRKDQGIDVSDEMNKEWMELVMRRKSFGLQATLSEQAKKMFFMVSTNLDKFREFIFKSSFLEIYEIDADTLARIKEDDIELMKFSFKYLASSLFGTKDLKIRQEKIKAKAEEIAKKRAEKEKEAEKTYEELKAERDKLQQKLAGQKK